MKDSDSNTNAPRVDVNPLVYPELAATLEKLPIKLRAEKLRHLAANGSLLEALIANLGTTELIKTIELLREDIARLALSHADTSKALSSVAGISKTNTDFVDIKETEFPKLATDIGDDSGAFVEPVKNLCIEQNELQDKINLNVNASIQQDFIVEKLPIEHNELKFTHNPNEATQSDINDNVQHKASGEPVIVVDTGNQSIGKSVLDDQTSIQVEVSEANPEPLNNQTSIFDVETMADSENHLKDEDHANYTNRATPVSLMHLVENISDSDFVASAITVEQPVLPIAAPEALINVESQPKEQVSSENQDVKQTLQPITQPIQKLQTEIIQQHLDDDN